jgi:hypothetical protein
MTRARRPTDDQLEQRSGGTLVAKLTHDTAPTRLRLGENPYAVRGSIGTTPQPTSDPTLAKAGQ